jgi:hypothetical protein
LFFDDLEDGDRMFLQNIDDKLPINMSSSVSLCSLGFLQGILRRLH